MTGTSIKSPITVPSWLSCPGCNTPLQPKIPADVEAYFSERANPCAGCGNTLDLWDVFVRAAREHFMQTGAFQLLGSKTTLFSHSLEREKVTTVDFVEVGIDPDAEILSINLTGSMNEAGKGALFPLRFHSNTLRYDQRDKKLFLYGAALGQGSPESGMASIAVTWVAISNDDIPLRSLVEAFRWYDLRRYDAAVVPANVAVETSIGAAMFDWLLGYAGKDRVEDFLMNAATYSHQLNVLLSVASCSARLPPIPDVIRGQLNRLRRFRNEVAHSGKLEHPLDKATAAEILTAAVFGMHYGRLLQREIQHAKLDADPNVPPDAC